MPLPVPNHMFMDLQTMIYLSYKIYCTFTINFIDFLSITEHSYVATFEISVIFQAAVGEREVTFSWSPSSGSVSIIGYIVTCAPSPANLPQSFPQSGAHRVSGFSPQTSYNCSVAAYTSQTVGPPATVVFTTKEDSKIHTLDIFITVIVVAMSYGYFFNRYFL